MSNNAEAPEPHSRLGPAGGIPCAGGEADWCWRQIAKMVDFGLQPIWRAAEPPHVVMPSTADAFSAPVQECQYRYWEFRREVVFDRETGEKVGKSVFARKPPETRWLPLDEQLARALTARRFVVPAIAIDARSGETAQPVRSEGRKRGAVRQSPKSPNLSQSRGES